MSLDIGLTDCEGVQDTTVKGLLLEGASWAHGSLCLSSDLRCHLPASRLRWNLKSGFDGSNTEGENRILFPLYLNDLRTVLVAELYVVPPRDIPVEVWSQRGASFIIQSTI